MTSCWLVRAIEIPLSPEGRRSDLFRLVLAELMATARVCASATATTALPRSEETQHRDSAVPGRAIAASGAAIIHFRDGMMAGPISTLLVPSTPISCSRVSISRPGAHSLAVAPY
jgi:hypothetical protein